MGKKALALLIAMLTIGQSFAMSGSAALDNMQHKDTSLSAASDGTGTFEFSITRDELQRAVQSSTQQSVKQTAINAPVVDTTQLTKGYSVDSKKFDLRNVNGKCYSTPVRSQAPFGTCWSFATIAAIESSILGAGLNGADGKPATAETLDLSEKQLAWFSARALNDPNSPQNGEGQFVPDFMNNTESLTNFMNRGGNAMFSTCALAQGIGPSHESSNKFFEYHGKEATVVSRWMEGSMQKYSYSEADDWTIPDKHRFESDYSIKETHVLPETHYIDENGYFTYKEEGTKAIKQELLNLRAVQVSFQADASMPGDESDGRYISTNWAHYTYIPTLTNHAVTIIGWDDNYPKENFIKGTMQMKMRDGKEVVLDKQPPANGAWLVKNSWGSGSNEFPDKGSASWGIEENGVHTGYFWLSYYDKSMSSPVSYVVEQSNEDVNGIDQHDYMPTGLPTAAKFDEEVRMANKFEAAHDEVLRQVSCFTPYPNTEVTYDVYLLDDTSDKPIDGIKVAEKKIKYPFSGLHKEDLKDFNIYFDVSGNGSNDFLLTKYQSYSIVVTQKTSDGKYVMNLASENNSGEGQTSFKGIINMDESYLLKDGEWRDYKDLEDLRKEEYVKNVIGGEDGLSTVNFDNFPIKGYVQKLDTDTVFELKNNSLLYAGSKSHNSTTLRFLLHTSSDKIPQISAETVKWGILPASENDSKVYHKGEAGPDPTSYKITCKEGESKKSRIYFTIKGIGTFSETALVTKAAFNDIEFPYDGKDYIRVFPYTGKEVKPCTGVSGESMPEPLVEGEDFELVYSNNIKCGLASVTAKAKGNRVSISFDPTDTFVIVPAKPVIKSVTADGTRLIVKISDQSKSEPSGYRVQYRVKGEKDWQQALTSGAGSTLIAHGIQGKKTYEVQVSGYTKVGEDQPWYGDRINYGEASDIAVVDTAKLSEITRIAGSNRFSTAAKISANSYAFADTVILACGMNYADALAGVPLAYKNNAPILLTGSSALDKNTFDEIKRLKAKNVIILGGKLAVSKKAEDELKSAGLSVERIAGNTRFSTATAIAEKLGSAPEDIFFVYGLDYADALSVSSVAAIRKAPVIYLNKDGKMNAETAQYLDSLKELHCVKNAYVIGGSSVICDDMMKKAAAALGIEQIERISGANRYETCVAVNEKFADSLTGDMICTATGKDFPDALAGGVYAALNKAPVMLVPDSLSKSHKEFIKSKNAGSVTVFGGTGVISDELAKQIAKAK